MTMFKQIPEFHGLLAPQFFDQLVPEQKPIVIRGFCKHWPLVQAGIKTAEDFANYLMAFYAGKKARIFVAPPAAKKRFFYNEQMTGVNFLVGEERVDLFLGRLLELMGRSVYPAISMQNALPSEIFPGLIEQNKTAFFPELEPRLWLGNQGIVSAHYDGADNLACVVTGRRRFVLFGPDQTSNLYPGSLNFTPAGAPVSLVDLENPDLDRYPNFKQALANGFCAELGPGDAIFIPMLWWHHVESLEKVNGLMNYWWNGVSTKGSVAPSPIDSLNIALLAMRNLNPKQRAAWRCMFDHYLFKQEVDPASYIPGHQLHALGDLSPEQVNAITQHFSEKLKIS